MKTVLKTLIVSTAFAAGGACADPTIFYDDTWLTGPPPSSSAPRAAAGAPNQSSHESHMQTQAQNPPQTMTEILALQPLSFGG